MSERLTTVSEAFNEIVEPISGEMELTANQIITEQGMASTALGDVLHFEVSSDPIATPFADDTLACTNPSCTPSTCKS
ncbi:MAG TPA: hypothetical protein VLG09_03320 [Candidatus Saccharimonadales bacterium]|nr:hypothetical protein [Candidatus Saccharimonadales bacterium]